MSPHCQVVEFGWGEVGKSVCLCVAPDEFDRIELGGVGRQQLGADAMAVLLEPTFDWFTDMRLQPIPDQRDGGAHCAAELPEKRNDVLAIEACIGKEAEVGVRAPGDGEAKSPERRSPIPCAASGRAA